MMFCIEIYTFDLYVACLQLVSRQRHVTYRENSQLLFFHIVYVAWVAWKLCDGKVRTYLGCNVYVLMCL